MAKGLPSHYNLCGTMLIMGVGESAEMLSSTGDTSNSRVLQCQIGVHITTTLRPRLPRGYLTKVSYWASQRPKADSHVGAYQRVNSGFRLRPWHVPTPEDSLAPSCQTPSRWMTCPGYMQGRGLRPNLHWRITGMQGRPNVQLSTMDLSQFGRGPQLLCP